jgi:SAM-dependent methyltransferase
MRVDVEELRRELAAWRSPLEAPGVRDRWVAAALPRIAAMLALVPEAGPEGRLLELGSPPFFTSVCLARTWPGGVTHTGYAHDGARRLAQRLVSSDGRPDRVFELDCFNVETDEFPYPDATFDVVVFSELIEHLAVNPVWTLAEIHRVLRPGGHVVVTTPNALSLDRLWTFLHGGSEPVDRYMPVFGYGARHNREWHPRELRHLLLETGFAIEEMAVRDVEPYPPATRALRAAVRVLLRPFSRQSRKGHILIRARRGDVFRWRFPDLLYDHMTLYRLVRHPFVEMDVNDAIQCGGGWEPIERTPAGAVRRVRGPAVAWLRGNPAACRLVVRARADEAPARVPLRLAPAGGDPVARTVLALPTAWTDVSIALDRPPASDEELALELDPTPASIAVRRIWLE